MTKDIFIKNVTDFILPLFTGSSIYGEEESTNRDSEVALGAGGTVLIKANKQDEYRIIIKRNQPFKPSDVSLLKLIIKEFNLISDLSFDDNSYMMRLYKIAIEKAICYSITENVGDTLLAIITELNHCATKTYEGRRISYGIIVNDIQSSDVKSENNHISMLFKRDFFSLFSDGKKSCIELDREGYLIGYSPLDKVRNLPTVAPFEYNAIAKVCGEKKTGVVLMESGEILVFKNHSLVFCKKRGVWGSFCHEEIIQLLSVRTNYTIKEIRKSIYLTSLDASFAGTGACLVYLNKENTEQALNHIDILDIITPEHFEIKKQQYILENSKLYNYDKQYLDVDCDFDTFINKYKITKTDCIRKLISGKKFQDLNRKLRQELVGIDGATIVDWDGTIVAVGAIIKIEAGSTGGGRLAATKTLAKYGVAIKVSADGMLQAFSKDRKLNKVKPLFSVG